MELSRRGFIKVAGIGAVAAFVDGRATAVASASVPTLLDGHKIPKFVTELPNPATLRPTAGRLSVSMRQVRQQMLPRQFPATSVFAYGPTGHDDSAFTTPSATIEVESGTPVQLTWRNELVDGTGKFRQHLLPVDPTLHWANPMQEPDSMGMRSTDSIPAFTGRRYVEPDEYSDPMTQYTLYRGPIPVSPHLHGGMRVGDESDGYPEAWYLPAARNLPAGCASHGRWYPFLSAKARRVHGTSWGPGHITATYPNANPASLLWYHDHALGMTRLNVYAGLVGGYVVRGGRHGDDAVADRRTGRRAILPGGRHDEGVDDELAERLLVIQDKSFHTDGSLFYPDGRGFFDDYKGKLIPESDVPPAWNPEFFGDTIVVNGVTWPRLSVHRRRYRWGLLNGTQCRTLFLDFSKVPGARVHVIGTEGGFLDTPVDLAHHDRRLRVGVAERFDLIVDLTHVPAGSYVVRNLGPDEPFQGGSELGKDWKPSDPQTTGQVLQLVVRGHRVHDRTTPARDLVLSRPTRDRGARRVRRLALLEVESMAAMGPACAGLGVISQNHGARGTATMKRWMDPVTENPEPDDCEIWEFYNFTNDAHPIHVHETAFEVLGRTPLKVDAEKRTYDTRGVEQGPSPWETGPKDTVIAPPGHMTRIKARFVTPGQYVWHCHMLEHEDNEMMRPFRIGARQAGQPADMMMAMPTMKQ